MALGRELPQSFQEALRLARRLLSANQDLVRKNLVDIEAEQIVQAAYRKATGKSLSRVELTARAADRFPEGAGEAVIILAAGRAEGKLLQHLIGYQVFLDHEYEVGPDVLVPRPETETLVAHAIEEIRKQYDSPRLGIEIGVGSGAIAIELLARFPSLSIVASELSESAEKRAIANSKKILTKSDDDSTRLKVVRAQAPLEVWEPFERAAIGRKAQFLISNPPYLLRSEAETDAEVAAHEPASALFAPAENPVHFYHTIAREASRFLEKDAPIFVEIPHERSAVITSVFELEGWKTKIIPDLNGRERVLSARL